MNKNDILNELENCPDGMTINDFRKKGYNFMLVALFLGELLKEEAIIADGYRTERAIKGVSDFPVYKIADGK